MPRKVRIPADPAQNRENQQRSRARRKAYLESLEARLREFEGREMRATLDMQRAAREVAWVNGRLLELLAQKGVGRDEVDGFLRRCRGEEEGEREGEGEGEGEGGEEERRGCGGGSRDGTTTVAPPVHLVSAEPRVRFSTDGVVGDIRNSTATEDVVEGKEIVVSRPSCITEARADVDADADAEEGSRARVLSTSCEAAASIIAGFQGHGDVSRAKNALGCGEVDAANCHVKNTRLFQLMDEA